MIDREKLRRVAQQRHDLHRNHASSRPLSDDYEYIGLIGEAVFGEMFDLEPDLSVRPSGDGGIDFTVPLWIGFEQRPFTIDVKTAEKAYNLIHEEGSKFSADIYVLGEYSKRTDAARMCGWEWGFILQKAPARDFGYGIINHYIPRKNLRKMQDLYDRRTLE